MEICVSVGSAWDRTDAVWE